MIHEELLGLPVELALTQLRLEGLAARLIETAPPRGARETGTLRVAAVRAEPNGLLLIAARFQDGPPET